MFDWHNPYPAPRTPVFARNVVATSHPAAAQAGLGVLRNGGGAVDAAIAAAAALVVTEPVSCGLGSDAFAIVWDGERLHGLNASGPAPKAWNLPDFARRHGTDADGRARIPDRGWDTVTVPGAVAAWGALHARFGRVPFGDVLAPAEELARRGVAVPPLVAMKWRPTSEEVAGMPGFGETFLPRGRPPEIGERFVFPGAARAMALLAEEGPRAFYEGEIAEAIVAQSARDGGLMDRKDLADFAPEWVEPLAAPFHGFTVHEMPPNGQGMAALLALGILEHLGLDDLPPDGALACHLQIEAMKLGFADVYAHVADPRHMRLAPRDLLDKGRLARLAAGIDRTRVAAPAAAGPPPGGTVYLAAADETGMMVSFIQSNYQGFGSGIVIPAFGVSLQNRGRGFSTDPASPNALEGGKRPFHTIIPAFLTENGRPRMAFGVMGADMQPQGHVQTLVRMLVSHQQPQAACDAPRWKIELDGTVALEPSASPLLREGLAAMGHRLSEGVAVHADASLDFGAGQFVWRLGDDMEDGYVAASDSRRDGLAAGW
ncbi:MAG: gamma-glutamyltransferase family protein [Desulfovibrio sp.]|jgi:gamma-glutamyltranspeptidase/glutathione hydrolase|nr:gamma-glutamyltransferase family protein [Desulfovibrio sp.]